MTRVRISTTVDAGQLARARRLVNGGDSVVIDHALQALIAEHEARAERQSMEDHPYESDPELAWEVSDGPPLPYDGQVPPEVLKLAKARRRR